MSDIANCANCRTTAAAANLPSLKACAKCKTTQYCSRDCQKADWKVHKKSCASKAASHAYVAANAESSTSYSAARLKDLEHHVPNPFTKLDQGKYLYDRPEEDVYKLLIDSFRIRQDDDLNFDGLTTPNSIYAGASSSIVPFRSYVTKASAQNVLPPWWNAGKQKECEEFGMSGKWNDLREKVTKQTVIDHYGDQKAPMQLRMLAEAVYGVGSMGQNGTAMRKMMSQMENGGPGDGMMSSMLSLCR